MLLTFCAALVPEIVLLYKRFRQKPVLCPKSFFPPKQKRPLTACEWPLPKIHVIMFSFSSSSMSLPRQVL